MHQFGCALAAKFQENVGAVSVQSSNAYAEYLSDLLPALSLCYELEHLSLARRELWLLFFLAHFVISLHQAASYGWTQKLFSSADSSESAE